jgi:hypothetical protein
MYSASALLISATAFTSNTNLFDNNYHQIVCLRNTSSYEIYIDNILRKSGAPGISPGWDGLNVWSTMPAQIANNPNDVVNRLSGSISIAKIYNRGLTQAEIQQNFNATRARFGV